MNYDPEKFKEKRLKVLGVKKRSMGFGTLALTVSVIIITGLGITTLPKVTAYMTTRNLDDAIFKLESTATWPPQVLDTLKAIDGITDVEADKHNTRLIVTFDRTRVDLSSLTTLFSTNGLAPTLLNRVNHRHRMTIQEQETME